jgi:acetyl-CoA acetyltransferase
MNRRVCVVGVGLADGPVAKGMTGTMLEAQAFRRALDDSGLAPRDIGGLASAGYGGMHEVQLAEYLGLTPHWLESTSCGGSSFEFQTLHAYRAMQAGDVDTVAIVYGNNQLTAFGRTLGTGGGGGRGAGAMPLSMSYEFPTGITLVGAYAMAARRHMHQYGTTPEQLASIAVQTREHAARNPKAMYREPITVDDVLDSKLVADPLHKLDCCVISDGGCCIILTTEERARSLPHRRVYVRGGAGGTTHHSIQGMADMTVTAAAVSGPKAFAEAGITPADVDVFAMYDSFTYTVLVVLEDLGFAPKGEGGPFVADGNLRLGGRLPTNTDGGGLSATHPGMRGLFLLCEASRQLRGEAGDAQVAGAEIAVAHGSGGWLSTQSTVVLGTEPNS